jgi:predicted MPP superfamily phosphohydrolase
VSDLHIGNRQTLEFVERSLMEGLRLKPDLVCMTGDFINRRIFNAKEYRALFRRMAGQAPVFASLGNHDGGTWAAGMGGLADPAEVAELLADGGVSVLRNQQKILRVGGQSLALVGLDDLKSGTMDAGKAFGTLPAVAKMPRLVMAHNPDTKEWIENHEWDIMLSGHTHGGQVSIPVLGTPVLPVRDRRFIHGHYRWNNRQLHISSGVGTSCGVRFNCPPEICMLTLGGHR